ncbi:MAG: WD40 repeat domain-containing protein [Gemmataceae bacterium]|nr:WD40 repeat domain-containing protein [Gemmataceae bacterium]
MFDPYHKWLGIPKDQRPPTFYQLLGLAAFETDTEVIDEAAIRQTTHVRAYQIGPQAGECTRILNEISLARQTLLSPAKKKEYDAQLAAQTKCATVTDAAAEAFANLVTAARPLTSAQKLRRSVDEDDDDIDRRKRRRDDVDIKKEGLFAGKQGLIIGVSAGAALLVGTVLVIALATGGGDRPKGNPIIADVKPPVVNPPIKPPVVNPPVVDPPIKPPVVNPPVQPPVIPVHIKAGEIQLVRSVKRSTGPADVFLSRDGKKALMLQSGKLFSRTTDQWDNTEEYGNSWSVLALSRDGTKALLVRGQDLVLWNWQTGKDEKVLQGGGGVQINVGALSSDGKWAATGTSAKAGSEVAIWDLDAEQLNRRYQAHANSIIAMGFSDDAKLYSLSAQQHLAIHDLKSGMINNVKLELFLHATISPDGKYLAGRATSANLHVYELSTLKPCFVHVPDSYFPGALRFAPDNRFLAMTTYSKKGPNPPPPLVIFDVQTGAVVAQAAPGIESIGAVDMASNGLLATADANGNHRLWRLGDGAGVAAAPVPHELQNCPAGKKVVAVACTRKPNHIVLAGDGLRLFDLNLGKDVRVFDDTNFEKAGLAVSDDIVYAVRPNEEVLRWELESGKRLPPLPLRAGAAPGLRDWQSNVVVALSRDGKRLFLQRVDGSLSWWNVVEGQESSVIPMNKDQRPLLTALAISPDGKRFYSGHRSGSFFWDIATRAKFAGQTSYEVYGADYHPDGDLVLAIPGALGVFGSPRGEIRESLHTKISVPATCTQVKCTPDGKWLVCLAAFNKELSIFSWPDLKKVSTFEGQYSAYAVAQDGTSVFAYDPAGMLRRFALPRPQVAVVPKPKDVDVPGLVVGRDGIKIAGKVEANDPAVFVRMGNNDVPLPAKMFQVKMSARTSYTIAMNTDDNGFDPYLVVQDQDGKHVAADDDSGGKLNALLKFTPPSDGSFKVFAASLTRQSGAFTLRITDLQPRLEVVRETRRWDLTSTYHNLVRTANPKHFLIGGSQLRLWDIDSGKDVRLFGKRKTGASNATIALHPDGSKFFAAHMGEIDITLWNLKSGEVEGKLAGHTARVKNIALTQDGKSLVSTGEDHMVRIWDTKTLTETYRFGDHAAPIYALAVSPDGSRAITFSLNRIGRTWDVAEGKAVHRWKTQKSQVWDAAFTPDGSKIACATRDGLLVFDGNSYAEEGMFTDQSKLRHIGFSPSAKYVFTVDDEHRIGQWDWATKRLMHLFEGHTSFVHGMACTADGKHLLTCGDKTLRLWLVEDGAILAGKLPGEKVAVPAEEGVKESEKEIRKQFAKEYALAKKSFPDRAALAERLHELSLETKDNLTKRYVLLSEARELAAQGGKALLIVRAVEELGKTFEVDERALNLAALAVVGKLNLGKDPARDLTETALGLAGACIDDEAFDLAFKFSALAETGARKSQVAGLLTQVQNQDKYWKELAKEFEEAKSAKVVLAKEADNAAAHLARGKYLALRRGDWDKALPHLAKGGDGPLPELARQDLAAPAEPAARIKLGDAWWAACENESGPHKYGYQGRAVHWYRLALPMLSGITQSEVVGKIKKFEEQPSPFRSTLGELRRFKGHAAEVTSLALSPDGKRLCSASYDGTLRTWDVGSAKLLHNLPISAPVASFALSPDQRHVFACVKSAGVLVVDMKSGVVVYPKGAGNFRECVPGGIWLGPERIYYAARNDFHTADLRGGGGAGPLPGAPVRAMVAAADSRQYVTLSEDGAVELHRIPGEGGRISQGTLGSFEAYAGAFSDDGKLLALGGKDHSVRLWKLPRRPNEQPLVFEGHTGPVRAVAVSADGKRLLSGSDDKTARVWDIATGKEIHRFLQHTGPVLAVLFSPDGRFALSAGADTTIRMWSAPR